MSRVDELPCALGASPIEGDWVVSTTGSIRSLAGPVLLSPFTLLPETTWLSLPAREGHWHQQSLEPVDGPWGGAVPGSLGLGSQRSCRLPVGGCGHSQASSSALRSPALQRWLSAHPSQKRLLPAAFLQGPGSRLL